MEYLGTVKYIGNIEPWMKNTLSKDKLYRVTDISAKGFINIELDIDPKSFFSDITEHFEIVEDPEAKLKELYEK